MTDGVTCTPEHPVHLQCGRADWLVRPAWRAALLGDGSPDWFSLERDPRAVLVKRGHARRTWRVALGDRTMFAKVVDSAGLVERIKRRLIGDAAQREWRVWLEAEARGVAVIHGVAVGARDGRDAARTVLLSEEMGNARPLPQAWEHEARAASPRERRGGANRLIEAVAHLFASSHERGFMHVDAHPNNILIRAAPCGGFEAVLLDVHSAYVAHRPTSVRRTLRALAHLDQYFHRRATRAERLRFLRLYLAGRPSLREPHGRHLSERAWLKAIRPVARRHAARLARRRDRRLRRKGPYFTTLSLNGGWRARVVLQLERRHLFPEASVPDRSEADWLAILGPLLSRIGDAGAAGMAFDHHSLQVEVGRLRRLSQRVRAMLGGSFARRAFERCHRLRHRDVPCELLLAFGEHRSWGLVDVALLIRPARTGDVSNARARGGWIDGTDRDCPG